MDEPNLSSITSYWFATAGQHVIATAQIQPISYYFGLCYYDAWPATNLITATFQNLSGIP